MPQIKERVEGAFSGKALTVARNAAGLSRPELAELTQLSRQAIAQMERGVTHPSAITCRVLGDAVGVTPEFFFREPPWLPDGSMVHFRRQAKARARTREELAARAALLSQLVEFLQSMFRVGRVIISPFSRIEGSNDLEVAAEQCRKEIGLPADAPIARVGRALERAGILLGSFKGDGTVVDGFCTRSPTATLAFFNPSGSPSRDRFTLAHELGHLVCHGTTVAGTAEEEKQANRFAGAFLIPRVAFFREFPRYGSRLNWPGLVKMKERWGVSLQAIVHRAFDLGVIDAAQYRFANIRIRQLGWRREEPGEWRDEEVPEVIPMALTRLRSEKGIDESRVAEQLGWSLRRLEDIAGVKAPPSIQGSNVVSLAARRSRLASGPH